MIKIRILIALKKRGSKMIYVNEHYDNMEQLDEINIASENLLDEFTIYTSTIPYHKDDKAELDFYLVPYTQDGNIVEDEILQFPIDKKWACIDKTVTYNNFDIYNEIKFEIEKIPEQIEAIKIFSKNIAKTDLASCIIEFINSETEEIIFSYNYHPTQPFKNVYVGTFARVSNGWKFYPQFEPYSQMDFK